MELTLTDYVQNPNLWKQCEYHTERYSRLLQKEAVAIHKHRAAYVNQTPPYQLLEKGTQNDSRN